MPRQRLALFLIVMAAVAPPALGQGRPDPQALMAAQREAMLPLSFMDGVWRGPAWILLPSGEKHDLTQTERVGPFLNGGVKVIEGRGHDADGNVSFNALGIISYNTETKSYVMRSYAHGYAGDFALKLTGDGFTWDIPAGPMTMRYTAAVKDGVWHEVGERIVPDQEPVRFFEMTLTRVGDTDWPAAGSVGPK